MSSTLRDTLEMLKIRKDGVSRRYFSIYFNERAGIVEFDGLAPRDEAETQAHKEAISEFRRIFPELSSRSAEWLLNCFKSINDE